MRASRAKQIYENPFDFSKIENEPKFNVVHDISQGPAAKILISDRENGKLFVWDKALEKMVDTYENKQEIGTEIYASTYNHHDSNIYLGKPNLMQKGTFF